MSEEDTLKTNEKIVVLMLIVAVILFAASFDTKIDYRIVISSLGMLPILKTTKKNLKGLHINSTSMFLSQMVTQLTAVSSYNTALFIL